MKVVVLKCYTGDNSLSVEGLSYILKKGQKYVTGFHVANLSENGKAIKAFIN